MKKILITGATGELGKLIIDKMVEQNAAAGISALVRDPGKREAFKDSGITLVRGDYDDYSSLVQAFKGIDTLMFVSASDIPKRLKQHENVINAAREAGVGQVVYTSFERRNETASSPIAMVSEAHLRTEQLLRDYGIAYTILRNNLYMDYLPMFLGEKVLESGTIFLPAGEGKAGVALREDMAGVAAKILLDGGHHNKSYHISGEAAYSFGEIAAMLSDITGKTIRYVSPERAEFEKVLREAGVPEGAVAVSAAFAQAIREGELDKTSGDISAITGKKPVALKAYLSEIYGA